MEIIFHKLFGFLKDYSTDHKIIQLSEHTNQAFDHDFFSLGLFIDLRSALDTVYHEILKKKISLLGQKQPLEVLCKK